MTDHRFPHPADLIAHVQRSHGTPVGPPPDQYDAPAPTPAEPWSTLRADAPTGMPPPDNPAPKPDNPTPRPSEPVVDPVRFPLALPPGTSMADYVVFEEPANAFFMGYNVDLTPGETNDLKQVLAGAVVRTLDEQKMRVREAVPNKKRR